MNAKHGRFSQWNCWNRKTRTAVLCRSRLESELHQNRIEPQCSLELKLLELEPLEPRKPLESAPLEPQAKKAGIAHACIERMI